MKIHFVTFGTENPEWQVGSFLKTKQRLADQAKRSGWFDKIFVYGENDTRRQKFWTGQHSIENERAATSGNNVYWVGTMWWKPNIVKKALDEIDRDEILVYMDAGCAINLKASKRFYEYIDLANKGPGLVCFGGPKHKNDEFPNERTHTKRDLLVFLNIDETVLGTVQFASGVLIIKKNNFTIKFIDDWCMLCNIDHFINEDVSFYPEHKEFVSHKNDQSILSCLAKKHYDLLNDYIIDINEFASDRSKDPKFKFPFKAMRMRDHMANNPDWDYPNDKDYTDCL
jgi:hypothetical protein